jgi:hypothetical protein
MIFYEYMYILLGASIFFFITFIVLIPSFTISFDLMDIETTLLMNVGFNRLNQRVKNLMFNFF